MSVPCPDEEDVNPWFSGRIGNNYETEKVLKAVNCGHRLPLSNSAAPKSNRHYGFTKMMYKKNVLVFVYY
jgi:hypothetical protein